MAVRLQICYSQKMLFRSPVEGSVQPSPISPSADFSLSSVPPSSISPSSPTTSVSPPHSHRSHALAISVGSIIGVAAALLLVYLAVVRWRQRNARVESSSLQQPFVHEIERQRSLRSSALSASPRSIPIDLPVCSNSPARSNTGIQVQTSTLDAATHQARAQEIERLASAIDVVSSTPINESAQGANEEIAALRVRIAQLQTQLNQAARWENAIMIVNDVNITDPPPEYQSSDNTS